MFLLIPKKIRVETALTQKQCRERLNREIIPYTRKPSLVAASGFIKAHKLEDCFFGSCGKDDSGKVKAEIFYHRAKKYDGSSAGFFGTISKREDGKGAVIEGSIRRTAAVVITSVLWTIITLLLTLILVSMKEYLGAGVSAAVMLAGLGLITYDRSEGFIREYLDRFAEDMKNE